MTCSFAGVFTYTQAAEASDVVPRTVWLSLSSDPLMLPVPSADAILKGYQDLVQFACSLFAFHLLQQHANIRCAPLPVY